MSTIECVRNRYKVLKPLDEVANAIWFTELEIDNHSLGYPLTEINPRFFRDGTYFDRDTQEAWVEYKGRAFSVPKSEFKYQYDILNAPSISIETCVTLLYTHGISRYIKHNSFHQDCRSNSFTRPVFRYQLKKLYKLGW